MQVTSAFICKLSNKWYQNKRFQLIALVLCISNAFWGGFCCLGSWNTWQREGEESADKPTDAAARNYFKVVHPAFKTVQNSGYVKKKIQYVAIHGEIINSKWVRILCSNHLNVEFLYQQECWNNILFSTVMKLANSALNLISGRVFSLNGNCENCIFIYSIRF